MSDTCMESPPWVVPTNTAVNVSALCHNEKSFEQLKKVYSVDNLLRKLGLRSFQSKLVQYIRCEGFPNIAWKI